MAEYVRIKSFTSGLTICMSENGDFEEIKAEIARKFSDGRVFFGNSSIAISFEGRHLTDEEENILVGLIHKNCDLNVVCIAGHDKTSEKIYLKAVQQVEKRLERQEGPLIHRGSLTEEKEIKHKNDVIILGDVGQGCKVTARGSVIVLGGLFGEVHAGADGDEEAVVIAFEMAPEKLKIGDFKYRSREKKSKWKKGKRTKIQPKIAYIKEEQVVLEDYTEDLLASL